VLCFALEQAVDEAAERLKVDPIALRQRWDQDPNRQRLYRWGADLAMWRKRQPTGTQHGRLRRGIGIAAANWLYLYQPEADIELAVRGGRLIASMAVQDMGTGSRGVIAATVAGAFGLEPGDVEVRLGDSSFPRGPISGGSRTTPTIVPVTLAAVERLQAEIRRKIRGRIGDNAPWRDLLARCPDIAVKSGRPDDKARANPAALSPFASFGLMGFILDWVLTRFGGIKAGRGAPGAVHIAEVEVDTWLGHVRVLNVYAGLAVGRPQVPALAHSQAEGSIIQGIGYALYEGRQVDAASGAVLTAGLEDYRIPGIADAPQMHIHFEEGGFEHVPGGGVGIGEVSTLPVAAAVANAVHNATGRRPRELPMRPDRVLALIGERGSA
jgi:xanthine dehydrogenase YagR molybdenum-binding subunit